MAYSYPLPKKSLTNFARQVFAPLKNGECVTALFIVGAGKRTKIDFLLAEKNILKDVFGPRFKNILFVKINPSEVLEISNLAYLNLILEKLSPSSSPSTNPLEAIKKNLFRLTHQGKEIIFIFDDFEFTLQLSPSIFSNLETLQAINPQKIHCLILSHTNLLEEETLLKMGNFKYLISQNICFIPLHEAQDRTYIIKRLEKGLSIKLPPKTREVLLELCDGHPQMLHYSLTYIYNHLFNDLNNPKKIHQALLKNDDLNIICMDIWNQLNEKEKEVLKFVCFNNTLRKDQKIPGHRLLACKIIKLKGGPACAGRQASLFSEIFSRFVRSKITPEKLTLNTLSKQIFLGAVPCSSKFSQQEHRLLAHLLGQEGQVVSRDQIGEIIWGKNFYDKYSDWAIDKLISSVRKKLDALGFPSRKLITLKKRGFCFLD